MMNKIKLAIAIFFSAWLFSTPLAAQSVTWDPEPFKNVGGVGQIKHNSIIIDDIWFRLSPTAKFSTVDNSNADIKLLKVGQMVGFNFIYINNRQLVDHLWLIPENEWSLYR